MSPDSNRPAEQKESFLDKVLDHHHHKHESDSKSGKEDGNPNQKSGLKELEADLKKDDQKVKEYYEKDKALNAGGQTYGGLM